jgi:hypothetical protein
VEHLLVTNHLPASTSHTPPLRLPWYLFAACAVVLGLSVAVACAVALTRGAVTSPGPFSTFADVFPGRPASAVGGYGFACLVGGYSPAIESCFLNLDTGVFPRIEVVVNQNVVTELEFTLSPNALRLGDLIVLWGQPEDQIDVGVTHFFFWQDHRVVATTVYTRPQSFETPIGNVYFRYADGLALRALP